MQHGIQFADLFSFDVSQRFYGVCLFVLIILHSAAKRPWHNATVFPSDDFMGYGSCNSLAWYFGGTQLLEYIRTLTKNCTSVHTSLYHSIAP